MSPPEFKFGPGRWSVMSVEPDRRTDATATAARLWFACDEPEREPDPYVRWHIGEPRCRGCAVKIEAQQCRFPDDKHVAFVAALVNDVASVEFDGGQFD